MFEAVYLGRRICVRAEFQTRERSSGGKKRSGRQLWPVAVAAALLLGFSDRNIDGCSAVLPRAPSGGKSALSHFYPPLLLLLLLLAYYCAGEGEGTMDWNASTACTTYITKYGATVFVHSCLLPPSH